MHSSLICHTHVHRNTQVHIYTRTQINAHVYIHIHSQYMYMYIYTHKERFIFIKMNVGQKEAKARSPKCIHIIYLYTDTEDTHTHTHTHTHTQIYTYKYIQIYCAYLDMYVHLYIYTHTTSMLFQECDIFGVCYFHENWRGEKDRGLGALMELWIYENFLYAHKIHTHAHTHPHICTNMCLCISRCTHTQRIIFIKMDLEWQKRPRPSSKCIYMIYLCTRMYLCFECQTHSLSHTHTNIYMYIRICAYVHINTHRERVIFIRVDVEKKDAKTLIKDRAGVNSIPTFQVWKSGTFRDQYVAGSFFFPETILFIMWLILYHIWDYRTELCSWLTFCLTVIYLTHNPLHMWLFYIM